MTAVRGTAWLAALAAGVAADAALAEVATDGTLGRRVRLTGRDVEVGAELGRVSGRNLFHSFERFGVEEGGSVTFTGPGGLDNVVSRVTGGEASRIDGTLASRVPGADVYLVNPSGIVFGPGARLDVPGSFHASSADEVRFPDGAVFSAIDPGGSTLSVAAPEAFGFIGAKPGAITVDGGILAVPPGEALSLVGGDVEIAGDGDGLFPGDPGYAAPEPGTLQALAGRVTLAALGGAGTVLVGTGEAAGDLSASVRLGRDGLVEVRGDGGGTVLIRGGRFLLEGRSLVFADNLGGSDARGGIGIETGAVRIAGGSRLSGDAEGAGSGSRLLIRTGTLELADGGSIGSNTFGAGDGGAVTVVAGTALLDGTLEGQGLSSSSIQSAVAPGSTGDAGTITIEADRLEMVDGAQIFSGTFGEGDGGTVRVTADEVRLAGGAGSGDAFRPSGLFVSANAIPGFAAGGDAGSVAVEAGRLEAAGGAQIFSGTFTEGRGGTVRVTAGTVRVAGGAPGGGASTSGILANAGEGSAGDAGMVMIQARDLDVSDGGRIGSDARGAGDAGRVRIDVDRALTVDGGTVATNSSSAGRAGDVSVQAPRVEIRDGGLIGSSGEGAGPAGNVSLVAGDLLVEDAAIQTEGRGAAGGRITVAAGDVIRLLGAEVTSSGIQPQAGASLITLRAPVIALVRGSSVNSLTGAGDPLVGSGEARLLGDLTFISEDSRVEASSTVELSGVDNQVGTGLQISPGAFLDAEGLLGEGCAARSAGRASSFTRSGRGGLPPSPDRPLASSTEAWKGLRPGGPLRADAAASGCAGPAARAG